MTPRGSRVVGSRICTSVPLNPRYGRLLVSSDPPTIEQLSQSLQELAASTEVCTDIPSAIRLVNTRQGGVAIVTSASLKSGTKVNVQLTIPGHANQFSVESEVCWCDAKGRAGLRFLSLSQERSAELKEWLACRLEQSLPESVAMKFRSTT